MECSMELDNDDLPIGRVLSRREALVLFGAAGATFLAACSTGSDDDTTPTATTGAASSSTPTPTVQAAASTDTPSATAAVPQATATTSAPEPSATTASTATPGDSSEATATTDLAGIPACIVVPELTEGPYFVDEMIERSDIRPDPSTGVVSEGIPLQLTYRVSEIAGTNCAVFPGVLVDVWHCDAFGVYSDVSDPGFNTAGEKFLRGYQVTDDNGIATFTTIYPGWYQGRAVHIHFKIRSAAGENSALEFTSQLFFDEDVTDIVHAQEPYASKGYRTLLNDGDNIYRESDGLLTLTCTATPEGYAAVFDIGIQTS